MPGDSNAGLGMHVGVRRHLDICAGAEAAPASTHLLVQDAWRRPRGHGKRGHAELRALPAVPFPRPDRRAGPEAAPPVWGFLKQDAWRMFRGLEGHRPSVVAGPSSKYRSTGFEGWLLCWGAYVCSSVGYAAAGRWGLARIGRAGVRAVQLSCTNPNGALVVASLFRRVLQAGGCASALSSRHTVSLRVSECLLSHVIVGSL